MAPLYNPAGAAGEACGTAVNNSLYLSVRRAIGNQSILMARSHQPAAFDVTYTFAELYATAWNTAPSAQSLSGSSVIITPEVLWQTLCNGALHVSL